MTINGLHLKLKTVDISGNAVKILPVEIYTMINLKILHASRCNIQRLSDLTPLDKLIQLDLDNNDLDVDVINSLPLSLLRVDLSKNHFIGLPLSVLTLINLTELNLSCNRIKSLIGIGTLVSLITLLLDDNQITEIPEEACNLVKLKNISLKNNNILKKSLTNNEKQSIPLSFFQLTKIENMDLKGNMNINKSMISGFEGIEFFIERRKKSKDKSIQGGAMTTLDLFGLD